jgi:hypothetical protein
MNIILETRLHEIGEQKTQASVHLSFDGWSLTVCDITLRRELDGGWRIGMPLVAFGASKRPALTMQGALKEAVSQALKADREAMRESGQKVFSNTHTLAESPAADC